MVNIYEAKAKLSEFVDAATKGERIVICKHNQPVAELRPVARARTGPRDLAPMFPGEAFTTPGFFEPLPDHELAAWEGTDGEVPKVAEHRVTYGAKPSRRSKAKARR